MVNNKAIKVSGEMLGMNFSVYHFSPLRFTNITLLKIPSKNGNPKYIATLSATVAIEMSTIAPSNPK